MGACNSSDDRKKKQGNPKGETPLLKKKIDIDAKVDNIKIINEEIPENQKLKSKKKIIDIEQNEYNYKLLDTLTNNIKEDKISGNCKLFELFNRHNLRTNADFIIEFENNFKIGYDRINDRFDDLIEEIFQNKVPDEINMNYIFKGLDIAKDIKKEYIDSNEIIGSVILDNTELFAIITYERNNNRITPYYYKRNENEELMKFNLFTVFCNEMDAYIFQEVKMIKHMIQIKQSLNIMTFFI